MHQPTFVDAASILFNLSGYRVVRASPAVGDQPRQVLIETLTSGVACPSCGVLSSRVQGHPVQHVKDAACGGESLDVVVRKAATPAVSNCARGARPPRRPSSCPLGHA